MLGPGCVADIGLVTSGGEPWDNMAQNGTRGRACKDGDPGARDRSSGRVPERRRSKTPNSEFCRTSLRPQRGAATEFARKSPKVRQPYGRRAISRDRAVRAWVQKGAEMRLNLGCRPAGLWTGRSPRARRSSCGSVWVWLRCGIVVASATDDGLLALELGRVLGGAGVWLTGRVDGSRRRPLRRGRVSAERPSLDLNSAARGARPGGASRCQSSPNERAYTHAKNLNSDLVFSSFSDVSLVCPLRSANLKNRGIQVNSRIRVELETAVRVTVRDDVAGGADERGWRGVPVR
jgi:hypothetical protein